MWVPRNAVEVQGALEAGTLEETPSFDGKESLPAPKRNVDLATDVAAMSTEGGVLLYGVREDDHGRLTVPNPFPLAGVVERIDQIVSTSIAEVPYIEIAEHPLSEDESKGYVSVLVPQSSRAPHQVVVGDNKRYYGRGAKGNRRLGEAEVARLYQRRLEWEQDQGALLMDAAQQSRFPPHPELAYLHAFCRPVAPDEAIWDRALEAVNGQQELQGELRRVAGNARPRGGFVPNLKGAANFRRQGADEWLFSTMPDVDPNEEPDLADRIVDIRINVDGRSHLFCGRAGATRNEGGIAILELVIAGNLAAFLAVVARIYELAGYHGQLDLGLILTGIRNGTSVSGDGGFGFLSQPYRADTYTRTTRLGAGELLEPEAVAGRMLRRFLEATTGRDNYDPFDS